ncbi:hypothetical protein EBU95_07825 [bacterium]|nr:hypothetical protein [bacterium]
MVRQLPRIYYYRAVEKLSKYFGVLNAKDLSALIAFQELQGYGDQIPPDNLRPSQAEIKLVDLIINTREGALPVIDEVVVSNTTENNNGTNTVPTLFTVGSSRNDLVTALKYYCTNNNSTNIDLEDELAKFVKLHHSSPLNETSYSISDVGDMLRKPNEDDDVKKLSAIEIYSPNISPSSKETEGLSIIFNGIPNLEMARLLPYLDVQFMFGKSTTDFNGNLLAPSIYKFLEGAVQVRDNSNLALITRANEVEGRITGATNQSGRLATSGFELFTSPQTMVNADTPNPVYNRLSAGDAEYSLRSTSVIDKFRPFLSFKEFSADLASSGVGLFSFKTGKLVFVLHDRSRLHEIADLVKSDLYGTTEIMIEYGWIHPDPPEAGNYYADLFNSTRIKEKYGIKNVQFTFDEVGQVEITLELFTKGSTDIFLVNIAQASPATRQTLVNIENMAQAISIFRQSIPNQSGGNGGNNTTREIRGIQVLDTLSDIQNNIRLSPTIVNQINQLRSSLRAVSERNRDVSALLDSFTELFGEVNQSRAARTNNRELPASTDAPLLEQLSYSIQNELRTQFGKLRKGTDPFIPTDFEMPSNRVAGAPRREPTSRFRRILRDGTNAQPAATVPGQNISQSVLDEFNQGNDIVSLGKLLMVFVGQPLVATRKYDEVQFLFYPFNNYAGYARYLNTANFVVDLRYLIEQYFRFRMESTSRAANVNINDFMSFLQGTIIDDPAAAVYGIDDLYEKTVDRNTNQAQTTARYDAVRLQTEISDRLRNVTPDGTFKMPQIQLYMEAIPRKNIRIEGGSLNESLDDSKTILRVHVFDQQASRYEGFGSILEIARDNTLSSFSNLNNVNANSVIGENQSREIQRILSLATHQGLIEAIPRTRTELNPDGRFTFYRYKGSQGQLKEFIMKTMPYIIYGCMGTTIYNASLTSLNDPALSSANMLRAVNANPQRANGEQPGGLPVQIIPAELSVTCLGNTLVNFGQRVFIDFQTGTSVDNIYVVNGVTHTITPGEFKSEIKFVFADGYGKYRSFIDQVNAFAIQLDDISRQTQEQNTPLTPLAPTR